MGKLVVYFAGEVGVDFENEKYLQQEIGGFEIRDYLCLGGLVARIKVK